MDTEVLMSQEGYDKLEKERDELVSVKRKEVSEKLKEARSYGDLSENAEYDAAKEEQAELEDRILKLETMMRNAKIISRSEVSADRVSVGLLVEVQNLKTKKKDKYMIVGKTETDPFASPARISNESAIGKGLMGKAVGDKIDIPLPSEIRHYEIKSIKRVK